nr:unnamed protein product [Callosobruchus analis]
MSKSKEIKHKQVSCYNKRHNAKDMSPLKIGDLVWVVDIRKYGKVIEICPEPRSYIIQTELRKYRRNRWHLIYAPYHFPNSATHTEELECLDNNSEVRSAGTSEDFTNSQCQGLGKRNEIEGGQESVGDGNNPETDVNFSRPKRSVKEPSHLSDYKRFGFEDILNAEKKIRLKHISRRASKGKLSLTEIKQQVDNYNWIDDNDVD